MNEKYERALRSLLSDDEDRCSTRHRILSDVERNAIQDTLEHVTVSHAKRTNIEAEIIKNMEDNENANLLP